LARQCAYIALVTPTHPREGYDVHHRKFSSVNAKEKEIDSHPRKPGQVPPLGLCAVPVAPVRRIPGDG
jgi:hypothetical protein